MTIQAKVVSKERQQAFAQGRVLSASTTRPSAAKVRTTTQRSASSSSSSSSSSDESNASSTAPSTRSNNNIPPAKKGGQHVDPLEDHAAYAKRMAKQEWLYATGQAGGGVPVPPPKPAVASSPARKVVSEVKPTPVATAAVSKQPAQSPAPVTPPTSKQDVNATNVETKKASVPSKEVAAPGSPPKVTSAAAPAPPTPPPPPPAPLPSELVTDEEERLHPGRREYLRMLELLEKEPSQTARGEEGDNEVERPTSAAPVTSGKRGLTLPQLTRWHYNKMYQEWLDADSDFPFLAYDHWERAEALAIIEMAGGAIDPGEMHQLFRQKSTRDEPSKDPNLRFVRCINLLEDLVVSDAFERKVNRFLHQHHKSFVTSIPARAKGEFQHADHEAFLKYGEMMEQMVLGELQRRIADFDETEFFDMLFQTDELGSGESPLSFALWEVLLSFLKFESFCELMDEYITVHYGVADTRGDTKTRSVVGSLRRSPPPSAASTTKTNATASLSFSTRSIAPVSTTSVAKPAGSSTVKAPVTTTAAATRPRPAVGAVVPNSSVKR